MQRAGLERSSDEIQHDLPHSLALSGQQRCTSLKKKRKTETEMNFSPVRSTSHMMETLQKKIQFGR